MTMKEEMRFTELITKKRLTPREILELAYLGAKYQNSTEEEEIGLCLVFN